MTICTESHKCAHCKALRSRVKPEPKLWVDITKLKPKRELTEQPPRFVERGRA